MKRFVLVLFCFALVSPIFSQGFRVSGKLLNSSDGSALSGWQAKINNFVAVTDNGGEFSLAGVPSGVYQIDFSKNGYKPSSLPLKVDGKDLKLDFKILVVSSDADAESGISEVSLNTLETDDETKDQNISGLLQSTNDPFLSTAAYTFGPLYFRTRGYDSENQLVYMNGIPVNDGENGRASFSEWGGLNDVMRQKDFSNGMSPATFSFGGLAGATNILSRASLQRKQDKLSYSFSNRAYQHRLMFTHSTGMMKNGWAYSFSLSRRWAEEGYVEGTFYDAYGIFASVEKKLNNAHSLALTAYAAPTRRGQQGGSTQEVYQLTGTNYYNPNWGYQNGEKRNARVKRFTEPEIILNHIWKIDEKAKLTTGLGYSFGYNGTSGLNWYNASDPRPDYYRYLPSYFTDPAIVSAMTSEWKSNTSLSQIDWDKLYNINYLFNSEGKQARYILEENRIDQTQLSFTSQYNRQLNDHINFVTGIELSKYTGKHFKVLQDLLGGSYWVDIDQFAQRDVNTGLLVDPSSLQNDLNNPNRQIMEGDRFGYDYDIHKDFYQYWANTSFTYNKFDGFLAAQVSSTSFWRHGNMKNGRFPDSSYGEGEKNDFLNFGIKGGLTYKISGRQFLVFNAGFLTRAPFMRNVYVSPRTRDGVIPDITSEKISSVDLSYIIRYPKVSARVTVYQTNFKDQTEINSFYHDDYLTFVNQSMYHINKVHQGVEFGAEIKASPSISVVPVVSIGNFRYTNRPDATISFDNGSKPDTNEVIYCKNFFVSGTPQTAMSLGFKYFRNYWFGNLNFNYFDQMYLDFNPERRTSYAISNLGSGDPLISQITKQERLDAGGTIDLSIGKSWKIKKYYINLNFSISNILDNQEIITGGYEQSRFDFATKNINKFPPKYYYSFGRTYFLNIGFRI
jgi:hypothetical protein